MSNHDGPRSYQLHSATLFDPPRPAGISTGSYTPPLPAGLKEEFVTPIKSANSRAIAMHGAFHAEVRNKHTDELAKFDMIQR